jgi:hypothetical protein
MEIEIKIYISVEGVEEECFNINVPVEDVVSFNEQLYQSIRDTIWRDHHIYSHLRTTGYSLGSGSGCGEEYSEIPGFEGPRGYGRLLAELGGYLPPIFIHPSSGHRFIAVEWLGSVVDDGYRYIDAGEAV